MRGKKHATFCRWPRHCVRKDLHFRIRYSRQKHGIRLPAKNGRPCCCETVKVSAAASGGGTKRREKAAKVRSCSGTCTSAAAAGTLRSARTVTEGRAVAGQSPAETTRAKGRPLPWSDCSRQGWPLQLQLRKPKCDGRRGNRERACGCGSLKKRGTG